jgi:hypothetical protein
MIADFIKQIIEAEDAKTLSAMNALQYPSCPINPERQIAEQKERERLSQQTLNDFTGDYAVAYKMRLSGLSERSAGNGCDRRTALHAIAINSINKGKFSRQPYQFICGAKGAKEYGRSSAIGYEVSCPKCKEIIERHNLSACSNKEVGRLIDSY